MTLVVILMNFMTIDTFLHRTRGHTRRVPRYKSDFLQPWNMALYWNYMCSSASLWGALALWLDLCSVPHVQTQPQHDMLEKPTRVVKYVVKASTKKRSCIVCPIFHKLRMVNILFICSNTHANNTLNVCTCFYALCILVACQFVILFCQEILQVFIAFVLS
jgi:hypothetical protein